MKRNFFGKAVLLLVIMCILLVRPVFPTGHITIACAANLQYAMDEIRTVWKAQGDSAVEIVFGSSGTLATQILDGAPYDLFLSADTEAPGRLFEAGQTSALPRVYAYGKLVLWTTKVPEISGGLPRLLGPSFMLIAIPDPALAPYGRAAVAALTNAGLLQALKPRIIYGESISQTAQYIATGAADAGLNAESIVLSKAMHGKGVWIEIDSALYPRIAQSALISRYGAAHHFSESSRLYSSLFSDKIRAIFIRYGYAVP